MRPALPSFPLLTYFCWLDVDKLSAWAPLTVPETFSWFLELASVCDYPWLLCAFPEPPPLMALFEEPLRLIYWPALEARDRDTLLLPFLVYDCWFMSSSFRCEVGSVF